MKLTQNRTENIWKSPYYYIVNNKSCFVNTHYGGEVFFIDRADKFRSGKSEVGGCFINSHCTTTSWCSLRHCSWNIPRRLHLHSHLFSPHEPCIPPCVCVCVCHSGNRAACKVSHINSHTHPTIPDSTNNTALAPPPPPLSFPFVFSYSVTHFKILLPQQHAAASKVLLAMVQWRLCVCLLTGFLAPLDMLR